MRHYQQHESYQVSMTPYQQDSIGTIERTEIGRGQVHQQLESHYKFMRCELTLFQTTIEFAVH